MVFGFGIFYFEDMGAFAVYLSYAFKTAGNAMLGPELAWAVGNYLPILVFAIVFMFPVFQKIRSYILTLGKTKSALVHFATGLLYVGLLILCIANLVRDSYNPFLYFRF